MATTKKRPRRGASVRARDKIERPKPRPGRQPSQPLAVLYREGASTVCAMLVHPARDEYRIESAKGPNAALGAFVDQGYGFGRIRDNVPDWARARVPQQCMVLGCASITSAPLN